MQPVVAMKVCGKLALGDQKITSKCLKAFKHFQKRYALPELEHELRSHLYKDIQRLLTIRLAQVQRTKQTLDRQLKIVQPKSISTHPYSQHTRKLNATADRYDSSETI